jgi:hypothetical protein
LCIGTKCEWHGKWINAYKVDNLHTKPNWKFKDKGIHSSAKPKQWKRVYSLIFFLLFTLSSHEYILLDLHKFSIFLVQKWYNLSLHGCAEGENHQWWVHQFGSSGVLSCVEG